MFSKRFLFILFIMLLSIFPLFVLGCKNNTKEYNIINELEKNKGSQFDPKIADIMLGLIKEGKIKIE